MTQENNTLDYMNRLYTALGVRLKEVRAEYKTATGHYCPSNDRCLGDHETGEFDSEEDAGYALLTIRDEIYDVQVDILQHKSSKYQFIVEPDMETAKAIAEEFGLSAVLLSETVESA